MEQIFGDRLRMIRKRRGMTQGDLAQALGVTVQTVVRYETLRLEEIKPSRVRELAAALQVEESELTGQFRGGDESEEKIQMLTRGLRMLDPEQRENMFRLMMPLIEQFQKNAEIAAGTDSVSGGISAHPDPAGQVFAASDMDASAPVTETPSDDLIHTASDAAGAGDSTS